MSEQAERIVDAMNAIHGIHSGFRAVHAKGACYRGRFTPTPAAAAVCIAPHLAAPVDVTVRFSNGSGKPERADGAKDERGMAVRFHLSDGRATDLVSLTLPVFFVRSAEDFLAFLEAQRPDPDTGKPDLERVGAFVNAHPETQRAIGYVMLSPAPASFAGCTFHAIHAFKLAGPDGSHRWVRYHWRPEVPEASLTDDETRALGRNYLFDEMETRLARGPVAWGLEFQLAGEDDDPTDLTVSWPDDRATIDAGRMEVTERTSCEEMIFDPMRVVDGIECADDPIIRTRSAAYSVSYSRRTAAR